MKKLAWKFVFFVCSGHFFIACNNKDVTHSQNSLITLKQAITTDPVLSLEIPDSGRLQYGQYYRCPIRFRVSQLSQKQYVTIQKIEVLLLPKNAQIKAPSQPLKVLSGAAFRGVFINQHILTQNYSFREGWLPIPKVGGLQADYKIQVTAWTNVPHQRQVVMEKLISFSELETFPKIDRDPTPILTETLKKKYERLHEAIRRLPTHLSISEREARIGELKRQIVLHSQ